MDKWPKAEIVVAVLIAVALLGIISLDSSITGFSVFGNNLDNLSYEMDIVIQPNQPYTLDLNSNYKIRSVIIDGYAISSEDSEILVRLDSNDITHSISYQRPLITGFVVNSNEVTEIAMMLKKIMME
jgi:hypothetical protein